MEVNQEFARQILVAFAAEQTLFFDILLKNGKIFYTLEILYRIIRLNAIKKE